MKNGLLTLLCLICISFGAQADEKKPLITLEDTLVRAYQENPTLRAARAELYGTHELTAQAQSNWRPTVLLNGEVSESEIQQNAFGSGGVTSKSMDMSIAQPVYRGGRTVSETRVADYQIAAQRAALRQAEQDVLLQSVQAYFDVVRDQEIVKLNKGNESVLKNQLKATNKRFDVGDVTRTDTSQAKARLAEAKAGRIAAVGQLKATRATFEKLVGFTPGPLRKAELMLEVPADLEAALTEGEKNNPLIALASNTHLAAKSGIETVEGEFLPELALNGSLSRSYDPLPGFTKQQDLATIALRATVPLYRAGNVHSRVRQAKHTANQRRIEIEEAQRLVREQVIQAWEDMAAARAAVKARRTQVRAAKVALDGVTAESDQGVRTTLDVLDAEQERLDARVALTIAQRDQAVAHYRLQAALGRMTADNLALPVAVFDPQQNYEQTKDKIFDTEINDSYVP